jgi:hypothetical protein
VEHLIPVSVIMGAFAVGIVSIILKFKERERARGERMLLVEKGLDVPKELYEIRKKKKRNGYRAARGWLMVLGLLCVFIGVAVVIVVGAMEGVREGLAGIIVIMIGLAFLASERKLAALAAESKVEQGQER